jgi:hypothetical protein
MIFLISGFQVARITGMSHWYLLSVFKFIIQDWRYSSVVKYLSSMHKALGSSKHQKKIKIYNTGFWQECNDRCFQGLLVRVSSVLPTGENAQPQGQ